MSAITGATGQLGRLVVEKLKDKVPAPDIVALARSTAKAADLATVSSEGGERFRRVPRPAQQ